MDYIDQYNFPFRIIPSDDGICSAIKLLTQKNRVYIFGSPVPSYSKESLYYYETTLIEHSKKFYGKTYYKL